MNGVTGMSPSPYLLLTRLWDWYLQGAEKGREVGNVKLPVSSSWSLLHATRVIVYTGISELFLFLLCHQSFWSVSAWYLREKVTIRKAEQFRFLSYVLKIYCFPLFQYVDICPRNNWSQGLWTDPPDIEQKIFFYYISRKNGHPFYNAQRKIRI